MWTSLQTDPGDRKDEGIVKVPGNGKEPEAEEGDRVVRDAGAGRASQQAAAACCSFSPGCYMTTGTGCPHQDVPKCYAVTELCSTLRLLEMNLASGLTTWCWHIN